MASSKKSLVDKFLGDASGKSKAPGRKGRKSSKASKSLSRELTRSPSSSGNAKNRPSKSGSDTLVALRRDSDDDADKEIRETVAQKPQGDITEPMEIEVEEPVHVEKLNTSLTASWSRPEGSVYSPVHPTTSDAGLPVFGSPGKELETSIADISGTSVESKSQNMQFSTPLSLNIMTATSSSVTSCPSTDSLASEMESYRLGSRSSSTSDVDTLKNSACEEINISECSSTSTPIKFSLYDNNHREQMAGSIARKPPMKFSLIREVATEELDSLSLSSDLSPTGTSFKSIEGRNRIDDFSDESDSSRMKESADLSDDPDFHTHFHFVPLNKQLQIVTSMDRLTDRSVS